MLPKAVRYTHNKLLPLFQCFRSTLVHSLPLPPIIITIITIIIIIQCWLVLTWILLCIVFVYSLLLIMINWMVFLFEFVPLHRLLTSTLGLWTCQLASFSNSFNIHLHAGTWWGGGHKGSISYSAHLNAIRVRNVVTKGNVEDDWMNEWMNEWDCYQDWQLQ